MKINSLRHILLCLVLLATSSAFGQDIVQHLLRVDGFTELHVKGDCDIDLRFNPDSAGCIVVRSTMAMYQKLEKALASGTLYISAPLEAGRNAKDLQPVVVYATSELHTISLSGRCTLNAPKGIHVGGDLALIAGGHSSISSASVEAHDINVSLSGSGKVAIAGTASAGHLNLSMTGSGSIAARRVAAKTLSATLRGSGRIDVGGRVSGTASVVVKGRGDVDMSTLAATLLKAAVYGDGSVKHSPATKCDASGNKANIHH